MYVPGDLHTVERLFDRRRSADFDDVVHAFAIRELEHLFVPIVRLGVVDEVRRAEGFGFLELVVG